MSPWLLLGLIVVVGAIVRLHGLGEASLWLDEAASVQFAGLPWSTLWLSGYDNAPPVYYSLLKLALLFGDSEFAVRLPSMVFGVLTIPMVYRAGQLLAGSWAGLGAALFFALSASQVEYSQEARAYSLLIFAAGARSRGSPAVFSTGFAQARRSRLVGRAASSVRFDVICHGYSACPLHAQYCGFFYFFCTVGLCVSLDDVWSTPSFRCEILVCGKRTCISVMAAMVTHYSDRIGWKRQHGVASSPWSRWGLRYLAGCAWFCVCLAWPAVAGSDAGPVLSARCIQLAQTTFGPPRCAVCERAWSTFDLVARILFPDVYGKVYCLEFYWYGAFRWRGRECPEGRLAPAGFDVFSGGFREVTDVLPRTGRNRKSGLANGVRRVATSRRFPSHLAKRRSFAAPR